MHMVHTNTAYETDEASNYKDGYLVVSVLFDEAKQSKIRVRVRIPFISFSIINQRYMNLLGVWTNISQFCEKIQQA